VKPVFCPQMKANKNETIFAAKHAKNANKSFLSFRVLCVLRGKF